MSSMQRLIDEKVVERLASHDATLFADSVDQRQAILHRMGWIGLAARAASRLPQYASIADQLLTEGTTDIVLLGMGGSSLASLVLSEVLGSGEGRPRLHVLDTTSPVSVAELLDTDSGALVPARTSVIVASKSGTTIEPLSLYAWMREWADDALGDPAGGHF